MSLKIITTYDEFLTLESDWNRLLAIRSDHSVFDTFEWNRIWLKHFQHQYELHCLVLHSKSRNLEISNILPLVKDKRRFHFIGIHDRDQSSFLAELSTQDVKEILDYMNTQLYTHVGLFNVSLSDAWKIKFSLQELGTECHMRFKKESFVDLKTYHPSQTSNHREVERKIKKFNSQGHLEYIQIEQPSLPEWFLEKLCDWEQLRYHSKGYTPRFCDSAYQQWLSELFHSSAIPMFANALLFNNEPIAIEFGYKQRGHEHLLHCHVFNDAFRKLSPGAIGTHLCIESARSRKIQTFNFGPGDMSYKKLVTDNYSVRVDIIITKNSFVSSVHRLKSGMSLVKNKLFNKTSINNAEGETKRRRSVGKWLRATPGIIFKSHRNVNNQDINVLCYHKVSDFDKSFLSVTVGRFHDQMNYLKKHFTVLSLSELKERILQNKTLPPRAIAITFDDGYRNNYEFVFPVIKQLNIPISIFLCGAYVRDSQKSLPKADPSQEEKVKSQKHELNSNVTDGKTLGTFDFYPWDHEKEHIMNTDQIKEMLKSGLVEFYPHTVTHPILTTISLDEARKEIIESKRWIESLLSHLLTFSPSHHYTPDIFAYPSGKPGVDFTAEHEQVVRESGFKMAFSLRRASNQESLNLMNIERRMVLNETLALFKLRIAGYFDKHEFPPEHNQPSNKLENPNKISEGNRDIPNTTGASIAKHTFIQTVGRALSLAVSVITIPILTRYFGPEQYGFLTTALSFLYFFGMLSEFGFYNLVSKEMPIRKGPDQESFFGNVLGLKLVFATITTLAAASIVWITNYPLSIKLVVVVASSAFGFQSFIYVFGAFLQYRLNTAALAIGDVLNKIGIGIFAILTWAFHLPLAFFVVGYLVGTALNIVAVFKASQKTFPVSFRFDWQEWKKLLHIAWPFWILSVITFIYFRADALILGLYHSQSDVGLYGAAYKLLEVLISFPTLFTGLLLPMLSSHFSTNNRQAFSSLFQKGLDSLAFFVFPMVSFVLLAAPFIIHLVAGDEFVLSTPILRILIIATGIIFFAHLTTAAVAAINSQRNMVPLSAVAAAGALASYLILIPRFSYFGAAWTTLAVELFVLCASFYLVHMKTKISLSFKRSGLFLLSAIIATIGFLIVPAVNIASFLLGSLLFGIIYIASSFATKALSLSFFRSIKSSM